MSKVTVQTLTPQLKENEAAISYLREFAETFGAAIRGAFNQRNKLGKTKENQKNLKSSIAQELEKRFCISNTEAKNAALRGIAAYDSQAELVNMYVDETYENIKAIR